LHFFKIPEAALGALAQAVGAFSLARVWISSSTNWPTMSRPLMKPEESSPRMRPSMIVSASSTMGWPELASWRKRT